MNQATARQPADGAAATDSTKETPMGPSRWVVFTVGIAGIVGILWPILAAYTTAIDPFLRLGGRFHVALVHFPVAFVVLAGVLVVAAKLTKRRVWLAFAHECAGFAAAAALVAAGSGWANAYFETYGGFSREVLLWHRWSGVGVAVIAVAAVFLPRRSPRLAALLLIGNAGLVGWVGHMGGTLVHGPNYFDVLQPQAPRSGVDSEPGEERTLSGLYVAVQTILNDQCVECHGPRKQKGSLRLDAPHWILDKDRETVVVEPGQPEQSSLYVRVTLPPSHDDFMPQKAEPLSDASLEAIRRWISVGAPIYERPGLVGHGLPQASVAAGPTPVVDSERTAVPPTPVADPSILARLRARGASVSLLDSEGRFVGVSFRQARPPARDQDLELLTDLGASLLELDLTSSLVSDTGLEKLASQPSLRLLRLGKTNITGTGVARLEPLSSLEVLDLHDTAVADEVIASIELLVGLERVYLWGSNVTDAAVKRLRGRRPELTISRGDAVLPVEKPKAGSMEKKQ